MLNIVFKDTNVRFITEDYMGAKKTTLTFENEQHIIKDCERNKYLKKWVEFEWKMWQKLILMDVPFTTNSITQA